MRGYIEVTNADELKAFEDVIDGFVDAVIKEMHILNRSFVQKDDRWLVTGAGFDVQVIFQSQNRDHDVEVILRGVRSPSHIDPDVFDDGMLCSIKETKSWPEREIKIGGLCGSQLFYRTRDKAGERPVLGPEIPSPVAFPATPLDSDWRQCSQCCDAWKELESVTYSRCPSCGQLNGEPVDQRKLERPLYCQSAAIPLNLDKPQSPRWKFWKRR
jgi:hypothetical protein